VYVNTVLFVILITQAVSSTPGIVRYIQPEGGVALLKEGSPLQAVSDLAASTASRYPNRVICILCDSADNQYCSFRTGQAKENHPDSRHISLSPRILHRPRCSDYKSTMKSLSLGKIINFRREVCDFQQLAARCKNDDTCPCFFVGVGKVHLDGVAPKTDR
jgi:hypothetical protein